MDFSSRVTQTSSLHLPFTATSNGVSETNQLSKSAPNECHSSQDVTDHVMIRTSLKKRKPAIPVLNYVIKPCAMKGYGRVEI
jgi:hypothetical protein